MSQEYQEYTEEKEVTLSKLSATRRLLEAILIVVALFAIYLAVALLSFSPSDPSWSQTAWHEPIHNLAGGVGAWLADTLFFIFGVLAYAIPVIMVSLCWAVHRLRGQRESLDYFALSLRLIGTLALILTSCGLAALNVDDIYYFASGGVLGSLLSSSMLPRFNNIGSTMLLLCVWAAGLTLFTGWSWLAIAEKIGAGVMACLTLFSGRRRDDDFYYADDDDTHEPTGATEPTAAKSVAENRDQLPLSSPTAAHHDDDDEDALFSAPSVVARAVADATDAALTAPVSVTDVTPPGAAPSDASSSRVAAASAVAVPAESTLPPMPESATALPVKPAVQSVLPPGPLPIEPVLPAMTASAEIASLSAPSGAVSALSASAMAASAPITSAPIASGPVISDWQPLLVQPDERIARSVSTLAPATSPVASVFSTQPVPEPDVKTLAPEVKKTAAVSPMFTAAEDASNPQVKRGMGPELPRPNPVRIPTRRELASYGIKLPSQRLAEQQARERDAQAQSAQAAGHLDIDALPATALVCADTVSPHGEEDDHPALAQEAALREAFAQQQRARYGETYPDNEDDDDALLQAQLARDFAAMQQARYGQPTEQGNDTVMRVDEPATVSMPAAAVTPYQAVRDEFPTAVLADNPSRATASLSVDNQVEEKVVSATLPESVFAISPYADLVNDTPSEPLFTLSPHDNDAAVHQAPADVTSAQIRTAHVPQPEPVHEAAPSIMDSLIHPFLMRNDQPLQKPTTPLPSLDLLTPPSFNDAPIDRDALDEMARLIETRLADYRVKATVVDYHPGPVITRFELDLAPGVKAARISNLAKDLARSLSVVAVRIVEVIPGKPYVGLELPNRHRQTVFLREVLDCERFRDNSSPLAVVLGKDISGQPVVADLAKMPHLLVAGTTGSGKSVGVNAMIISMLYKATPADVRFIMIDPKMLELSVYEGIPHLLTEVVTDMKDAANALRWCVGEMERRYKLMSALGVRNLSGYNERVMQAQSMGRPVPDPFWKPGDSMEMQPPVLEKLPYIVVMVDEFADLMMAVGKKVEELIARLAQKARAAGIHLVLATQRPSVDVITGLIKANIPTRVAFTVSSKIDSRTILDRGGRGVVVGDGRHVIYGSQFIDSGARAWRVCPRSGGSCGGAGLESARSSGIYRQHYQRQ